MVTGRAARVATACVAVALGAGPATGCGDGGAGGETVTVLAAASLTDAFDELGAAFEEEHPGTSVEFGFGASSSLREQVLAGAPADVYASADAVNMERLVEAGAAAGPEVFATNGLQVVVPAGNPGGVTGLADLARDDLLVGLCAEEVPCGAYGREALASAGVTPALDTNAPDARALLTQVASGDLDAGIVYRTDVLAAGGEVEALDIPAEHDVVAEYLVAPLAGAPAPGPARAFVEFVTASGTAAGVLAAHGFAPP